MQLLNVNRWLHTVSKDKISSICRLHEVCSKKLISLIKQKFWFHSFIGLVNNWHSRVTLPPHDYLSIGMLNNNINKVNFYCRLLSARHLSLGTCIQQLSIIFLRFLEPIKFKVWVSETSAYVHLTLSALEASVSGLNNQGLSSQYFFCISGSSLCAKIFI